VHECVIVCGVLAVGVLSRGGVWLMFVFLTKELPSPTPPSPPERKKKTTKKHQKYFIFFCYINCSGVDVAQARWAEWPPLVSRFLVIPCDPLNHVFLFLSQTRIGVTVSISEDGTLHIAWNLSGGEESGLAYQTQQEHSEGDAE